MNKPFAAMPKYHVYKDSGVEWLGEIPTHWEVKRVKFLFSIGRGRVISQQELDDYGNYPVYSSQTKNDGVLGYINTYDFDCSQITWTTDGANAGTVFLRKGQHNCTNVCGTLQPINNNLSLKFITNALGVAAQFYKRPDTNGAKIMNGEMSEIFVVFPPLPEQKAIAEFLDKKTSLIDEAISVKEQQITLLKERKQILIQNAVTQGLNSNAPMRDSGVEWIGKIPRHWEVKKLKHLLKVKTGFAFPSNQFIESGVPLVRIGELKETGKVCLSKSPKLPFRFKNYLLNYAVKKGDILMAMTGGTIGKVAEYLDTQPALLNQRVCCFNAKNIKRELALAWMKTPYWYNYISLTADGGAQPNISDKQILEMTVVLPTLSEQTAIVAHIEKESAKIDQAIALNQQQIAKLKEYKTTLINSAVTGKIKVVDSSEGERT